MFFAVVFDVLYKVFVVVWA